MAASGFAVASDAGGVAAGPALMRSLANRKQIVDGVSYKWKPYIEAETGYDSNPDNLFASDPSSFVKLESGLKVSAESEDGYYAFFVKGRYIDFVDLEDALKNRWDFRTALEGTFNLSETETVQATSSYLRDFISLSSADVYDASTTYSRRTEDYRLSLVGKSHVENFLGGTPDGLTDLDTILITRPDAFDYARIDGQAKALVFTREKIQPFGIFDLASINYFNQAPGADIDRDATEIYGVAGARLQINKDFRIDVGYRVTQRDFEDPAIGTIVTNFVDINMFWQPRQDVRITAIVERYFDEPDTSLGFADDVKSYGVTLDWDLAKQFRLTGSSYYEQVSAIGDDVVFDKVTTAAALTFETNDNLNLFMSGLVRWVGEQVSDSDYERYKIGVGARMKF